jgi:hypothetical protein
MTGKNLRNFRLATRAERVATCGSLASNDSGVVKNRLDQAGSMEALLFRS